MMQTVKQCLLCALVLLFTGCATVGPIEDADNFIQTLNESIDLKGEPIQQYSRGLWHPLSDSIDIFARDFHDNDGVIVLTKTRLLFVTWDSDAKLYKIACEIYYANARDVRRRVWAAQQRFVLETKDGRTDAFTPTVENGQFVSTSRVNKAIAFLRTKIKSSDAWKDAH